MENAQQIIRSLSEERFTHLFKESPKKVREFIFTRFGIKSQSPSAFKFAVPGQKTEQQTKALYQALKTHEDKEVSEEIIRNYLMNKRQMLADTLDHLKIPHDKGLTENDIDVFASFPDEQIQTIVDYLVGLGHPREDALLYLQFMKATTPKK